MTLLSFNPALARDLIKIDGSSTVFPIVNAFSQQFMEAENGSTKIAIGISGTGGGFKKFCRGEIDIANASRPIKDKEKQLCTENGIEFLELPIALDALTVVVNKENTWAESMTVAELKTAWSPRSENIISSWQQINPNFPNTPLTLYGPGADSGTYDYFVNVIVERKSGRKDYSPHEDDNVLAGYVAKDPNSMAFFGLAYYEQHKDALKAVAISWNGNEPVLPSLESAASGDYQPLSRPVFIYVNGDSVKKRVFVHRFVEQFLDPSMASTVVSDAGYVPLTTDAYKASRKVFDRSKTGSHFGATSVGSSVAEVLSATQ